MSDTDTRSVAEIMGWTSTGGYGAEYWWVDTDGGEHVTLGRDPSPDDMLSWLVPRCVSIQIQVSGPCPQVMLSTRTHIHTINSSPTGVDYAGPTLHAALEAAVRAVAEAER